MTELEINIQRRRLRTAYTLTALGLVAVGVVGGIIIGAALTKRSKKECGCVDQDYEPDADEFEVVLVEEEESEEDIEMEDQSGLTESEDRFILKGHDEFPLSLGSEGQRVERLQVFLLRQFGWTGKVTGVFDKSTLEKVRKFMHREVIDKDTFEKYQMDKMVHDQRKNHR